jgi:hypothetical protein
VSEIEADRLEGASIAGNRMQLGIINSLTDQPDGVILEARPLPFCRLHLSTKAAPYGFATGPSLWAASNPLRGLDS